MINEIYFLRQEQFDLFRWRKDYLLSQFPYLSWFTHDYDDYEHDVIEYQVIRHSGLILDLRTRSRSILPIKAKICLNSNCFILNFFKSIIDLKSSL